MYLYNFPYKIAKVKKNNKKNHDKLLLVPFAKFTHA